MSEKLPGDSVPPAAPAPLDPRTTISEEQFNALVRDAMKWRHMRYEHFTDCAECRGEMLNLQLVGAGSKPPPGDVETARRLARLLNNAAIEMPRTAGLADMDHVRLASWLVDRGVVAARGGA